MMDVWSRLQFIGRASPCEIGSSSHPMTTDASNADGTVSEDEIAFMRRRSATGFGAGITACAYVQEDGRSWCGIGASADEHCQALRAWPRRCGLAVALPFFRSTTADALHGPALAGERGLRAPSPVASLRPGSLTPREMTPMEVQQLVDDFGAAAGRARKAGFDGVECMAPITTPFINSSHRAPISERTSGAAT